jgi:hypothetical protein
MVEPQFRFLIVLCFFCRLADLADFKEVNEIYKKCKWSPLCTPFIWSVFAIEWNSALLDLFGCDSHLCEHVCFRFPSSSTCSFHIPSCSPSFECTDWDRVHSHHFVEIYIRPSFWAIMNTFCTINLLYCVLYTSYVDTEKLCSYAWLSSHI